MPRSRRPPAQPSPAPGLPLLLPCLPGNTPARPAPPAFHPSRVSCRGAEGVRSWGTLHASTPGYWGLGCSDGFSSYEADLNPVLSHRWGGTWVSGVQGGRRGPEGGEGREQEKEGQHLPPGLKERRTGLGWRSEGGRSRQIKRSRGWSVPPSPQVPKPLSA